MATTIDQAEKLLKKLSTDSFEKIIEQINQIEPSSVDPKINVPSFNNFSNEATKDRYHYLENECRIKISQLSSSNIIPNHEDLKGNIEQYIGMTCIPTGLVGPVLVKGTVANGEYHVPMATTEGALVASYNRGSRATRLSGGITSVCLTERVQRAPSFKFKTLAELGLFINHVIQLKDKFNNIVTSKSNHAKLEDVLINMEGNTLILIFEYSTGDAAGQNMVTFCTEAICQEIIRNSPVTIEEWFIESNYSGDKKATSRSFSSVRGRKTTSECILPRNIVNQVLKSTPEAIASYWQSSTIATIQSGSIGAQGHMANGLTAIFMASGQDVACISEASIGITRMQVNKDGNLYVSVTLPALIVGTVGGGTSLPTQKECLEIMGCLGTNKSRKFAEIIGATILAGEVSIAAAISAGHFSSAHELYGRKTK